MTYMVTMGNGVARGVTRRQLVRGLALSAGALVASVPFLQTARTYVKASQHLHGDTIRFETTWREKPRNPAG
jgi:hypothetical protein